MRGFRSSRRFYRCGGYWESRQPIVQIGIKSHYDIGGRVIAWITGRKLRLTKERMGRMIGPKLNVWIGLLVCGTVSNVAFAQGTPPLVIEGGTLIDGNGGAPIPDVQIVIRGNKITS